MSFLKNISQSGLTDHELAQSYRSTGNLVILGELYQRYMDLLYGVCLKYLKDDEKAKDAVMQIFEELVVKLRKHEVENVKGWIYQVTKNHCLMQLRTPKNLKTVEIHPDLMQSPENVHLNGVLEREENLNKLEYCIGTLSNEQQQMIKLFYLQGKCYQEIVDETGTEWNQVRSYIQNGRRNLKTCMEKSMEENQNKTPLKR
ncbi:MAG: sigma-70 family RNA polymerase sigma factor [Chitinophagaceae bacterium]|nr:sigma-70 family RNA polymerase sigma factor [Chitinophagaceae bacterium]